MDNGQNTPSYTIYTISTPKELAEEVRRLILEKRLFDPERSIGRDNMIHFPVRLPQEKGIQWLEDLFGPLREGLKISTSDQATSSRDHRPSPFEKIAARLEGSIDPDKMKLLPDKWDMIGDCLVLKLPPAIGDDIQLIAQVYQDILDARYSLNDLTGIQGELRQPNLQVLTSPPDGNWEVIHVENSIKYSLDPLKVMFSSGNVDERIGIADIINKGERPPRVKKNEEGEIILDMFAGIGYFTLPISLKCRVEKVYAVEKNPISFYYLEKNIQDNRVEKTAVPIYGDNRKVEVPMLADRVIMGYVGGTVDFVTRAVELSSKEGCIVHMHDTVKVEDGPLILFEEVKKRLEDGPMVPHLLSHRKIKSYAPRIDHIVLDILLGPA
jgi:tRNA wybutosine-synthesizing protein 2